MKIKLAMKNQASDKMLSILLKFNFNPLSAPQHPTEQAGHRLHWKDGDQKQLNRS